MSSGDWVFVIVILLAALAVGHFSKMGMIGGRPPSFEQATGGGFRAPLIGGGGGGYDRGYDRGYGGAYGSRGGYR